MKPADEDLENRRPVWAALMEMFRDTDPVPTRSARGTLLAASPYATKRFSSMKWLRVISSHGIPGRKRHGSMCGGWKGSSCIPFPSVTGSG
jgi:hypothetical protein